jgi:hypothetical protein
MRARLSFYRRFIVIGAASAAHLVIMLVPRPDIGQQGAAGRIGIFVIGHVGSDSHFSRAWTRLKEQYPDTMPAGMRRWRAGWCPLLRTRKDGQGPFALFARGRRSQPSGVGADL